MAAIRRFFDKQNTSHAQGTEDQSGDKERDAQTTKVDDQADISGAFRKMYQAMSEVSKAVAELPIADQEMYNLMTKMDQLNLAFSDLRRIHSQPASSVSSFPSPPPPHLMNPHADDNVGRGQPSTTTTTSTSSLSLEERINAISLETKQELNRIKTKHTLEIKALAGTVAILTNDQKDMRKRLATSEEKLNVLVNLQSLLNNLHLNVEDRTTLKGQIQQVAADLVKTNEILDSVQLFIMDHTDVCSKSEENRFFIGFYASASTKLGYYNTGETIEFTRVLLNASSCYDDINSTFTAPENGVYFFSASINLNSKALFTAVITCNDEELALFGAPAVQDLQTSTSTLAALTKGDEVKVKVYGQTSPDGVQPGSGFSNFLGFRLP